MICSPFEKKISRSSGRPAVTGTTPDGRLILVVYEQFDDITVYPLLDKAGRKGTLIGTDLR